MELEFRYEEMLPNFDLSGTATLHEGAPVTPGSEPSNSKTIFQVGQDWYVRLQWKTTGWLNCAMAGDWQVRVLLEKMGVGETQAMPAPMTVPFKCQDPGVYYATVPFVGQSTSIQEGIYKVVVALTLKGPGGAPLPIAAMAEGPMIQFYEAPGS